MLKNTETPVLMELAYRKIKLNNFYSYQFLV